MTPKPSQPRRAVPKPTITPAQLATQIRQALKTGGSTDHAAGVQWFFKGEIKSHGWYTADLRRAARTFRREILKTKISLFS